MVPMIATWRRSDLASDKWSFVEAVGFHGLGCFGFGGGGGLGVWGFRLWVEDCWLEGCRAVRVWGMRTVAPTTC